MQTILILKQFDGTSTAYPHLFDSNDEKIEDVCRELKGMYPGASVARVDFDLTQPTPSTFQ